MLVYPQHTHYILIAVSVSVSVNVNVHVYVMFLQRKPVIKTKEGNREKTRQASNRMKIVMVVIWLLFKWTINDG